MQITELQHAIEESARELQDVQSKRGQIEKELIERYLFGSAFRKVRAEIFGLNFN